METRAEAGTPSDPMPALKSRLVPAFGTWVPTLALAILAVRR